jgi:membrane-associated PAP2 superfamily phosphatase
LHLWWQYTRSPLAVFIVAATIFATTRFDPDLAHALFFDADRMRWMGTGNWWVNQFIHSGGQWLLRGVTAAAILLWIATYSRPGLRQLRRPAAYFVVAVILSIATVGLLKTVSNVHCPWALAEFGGNVPFVHLFSHRSPLIRHGQCFPAAHSSSGYALFALYFVFRERSRRIAKLGLSVAIVTGLIFGIAQQSRGAHFVSHDLWSAFLAWMITLTIYAWAFRARLWDERGRERQH